MDHYLILKTVHIVGVVLFVGNIIVTGFWKVMANRTGDAAIIAFAQRLVTLTDWIFTLGGSSLVAAAGMANVIWGGIGWDSPWVIHGGILFTASGVVWVVILVPLQTKLGRLAREFAQTGIIPDIYWRLDRWWLIWGSVATILPLAVIPVMVFK